MRLEDAGYAAHAGWFWRRGDTGGAGHEAAFPGGLEAAELTARPENPKCIRVLGRQQRAFLFRDGWWVADWAARRNFLAVTWGVF